MIVIIEIKKNIGRKFPTVLSLQPYLIVLNFSLKRKVKKTTENPPKNQILPMGKEIPKQGTKRKKPQPPQRFCTRFKHIFQNVLA